ncbi:hypothetical protein Golax_023409, partial [Gossypium laxum]|nr:hypothetical protein [Gossypium laxum]
GGLPSWQCYIGRCAGRRDATEESKNRRLPVTTAVMSMVSLYVIEWTTHIYSIHNEFQWTLYEDPAIRTVIPDEFLQNLNVWHAKVALINYATVEMHQSDRVLR